MPGSFANSTNSVFQLNCGRTTILREGHQIPPNWLKHNLIVYYDKQTSIEFVYRSKHIVFSKGQYMNGEPFTYSAGHSWTFVNTLTLLEP